MKPASDSVSKSVVIDVAVILLASIAVVLPIYIWGIPYGNDMPQHYQFALQFEKALWEGTIYPAWAPDPNGGLGDVGVRFYPPLPYYALVFFKTLSGGWYSGSALTFAFWFCLGGFGVYFLSREWLDSRSALLGALVYTLLPYHVNQIYNAFFYAEFAGAAVLPFCFLFVTRVVNRRSSFDLLGLSTALAVLVLTHLPTAVMGLLVLGIYSIAEILRKGKWRSLLPLAGAALLGAAASSFYWIKLVTELDYLSHATAEFTKTTFDFHSNFLLAYFYVGPDDYVSRSLWFADLIFLLTIATIFSSLLIRRLAGSTDNGKLAPVLAIAAVAVFLSVPLSWPVWEKLELLQKIQFPFRFLAVISICAALIAAASRDSFLAVVSTPKRPLALIASGVLLVSVAFSFAQVIRPAMFTEEAKFNILLADLPTKKSCECWWPVWAKPSALTVSASAGVKVSGSIPTHIDGVRGSATMYTTADGTNSVGMFYYPHWRLSIDGSHVQVQPNEHGMIKLPYATEAETLELIFKEPFQIRAAQIVSIGVWAFMLLFVITQAMLSSRRYSVQIK